MGCRVGMGSHCYSRSTQITIGTAKGEQCGKVPFAFCVGGDRVCRGRRVRVRQGFVAEEEEDFISAIEELRYEHWAADGETILIELLRRQGLGRSRPFIEVGVRCQAGENVELIHRAVK